MCASVFDSARNGTDLVGKFEGHRDLGFDLDWFAVQKVRAILPLLHSIDRGLREHRVSSEHLDSGD